MVESREHRNISTVCRLDRKQELGLNNDVGDFDR